MYYRRLTELVDGKCFLLEIFSENKFKNLHIFDNQRIINEDNINFEEVNHDLLKI